MYNNKKEKTLKSKIITIFFILFLLFFILKYSGITILKIIPEKTSIGKYFISKNNLILENKKIKEENLKLKSELKIKKIQENENIINDNIGYAPIISQEDDSFYNNLIVRKNSEHEYKKDSTVITKNGIAIGTVGDTKDNIIDIKYFSKPGVKSNLLLKNYFINKSDKNIHKDNVKIIEKDLKKDKEKIDEKQEDGEIDINDKKDDIFKQNFFLDSFKVKSIGYSNGFFYVEIPREYKISKDSVVYLQSDKMYPVATFVEEKDSEQIPIKKVFYKMFENPNDVDVVRIVE